LRVAGAFLAALAFVLAAAAARADVQYSVEIKVERGYELIRQSLESASYLVSLKDHPPPSAPALRRRAEQDLPRLSQAMEALGYWEARVEYVVDTTAEPARVTVTVTPGPLYHLASVHFLLPSGEPAPLLAREGAGAVGLDIGAPALSAPVEGANDRIVALYADNGRPFAKVTDRHVVIDTAKKTMEATYTIEPGPQARFGPATITGLARVARGYVMRRVAWHEGDAYDQRLVTTTSQDLVRSALFSGVEITHADAPAPDGTVAMTVAVTEAPRHSVGIGAGYNTNVGLGASTFWEDRNLFGNAEDLRLSAGAAQRQLGLAANFRRPDAFITKQDFLSDAELLDQHTPAYTSRRARAFAGLEELMFPPFTFGGGASLEKAYLTDTSTLQNENYLLFGTPFYMRRDTTDDLLDPTAGTRLSVTATPYLGVSGPSLSFISTRIEGRAYRRLTDSKEYVLAAYAALGTIEGASLAQVPVDKRLYAGGAGSVRGYGYQRAGPLNSVNVPTGGRSSFEAGAEFRWRFTETFGLVPFFDAGNVYPTNLPNRLNLFYSAGIGLRYYTAIGPVRLDLAFPIEKRPSDSPLQVYISIGQAF
jgi:translocation and assembly module TamA